MSKRAAFCIATSRNQADQIMDRLRAANFSHDDISVLFHDNNQTRDFAQAKSTKGLEGVVAGASTGVVVGAVLGWIAGMGALAIPGAGPLIAAGPIIAALSGAAIGATIGGIAGGLVGLGIPDLEARIYEGRIRDGSFLISVLTGNQEEIAQATAIFKEADAQDICITGEAAMKDKAASEPVPRPAAVAVT